MTDDIEKLRFNVAVAHVYELSNVLQAFKPADATDGWVLREALEGLVRLVGPMMPHLAEEMWQRLGHAEMLAEQPWPVADPELLIEETSTIAVQVQGKLRATLELARDSDEDAVKAAALAEIKVQRAIDGRDIRKVIVVPNRIVNIVV